MRVAILANFPLHTIPRFADRVRPEGHFASWLPPLAQAWSKPDGIERHWITLSDAIEKEEEFSHLNQSFTVLPSRKSGRASSLFREDRAAIEKTLRRIRPNLVHGWGTEDVYALAAVKSGRPRIVSMQGLLSHYMLHTYVGGRTLFQALLELYILPKADVITCETQWAKPILQRRAPRVRIECIEYGAHPDFFSAAWAPDPERPAAIFVGTLTRRKGFHDLLQAFESPRLKHAELWVAGSGPLEKRAGAPSNVRWLGRLDRASLIEKMGKAWCLALPTRADTSPNVVKEARVMGLPVITTPCGGQSDYIEDGRNGFIVKPGDIPRLVESLEKLLSDFDYGRARGLEGWERDRSIFRPELTAEKFSALYRSLGRKTGDVNRARPSRSEPLIERSR